MKTVWDNVGAMDVLEQLPEVDADRIGVIGDSLGGHNTIFAAFHGCRLRAVVSNCGFRTFQKDDLPSRTGRSTCRGSGPCSATAREGSRSASMTWSPAGPHGRSWPARRRRTPTSTCPACAT
jgi:hypothetical protein